MSRKRFTIVQKRGWIELYESGKTEHLIAKEFGCDIRTIKKGIEEASRNRDARVAREDMVKEALRKHQSGLLAEVERVQSDLGLPAGDSETLRWDWEGESISVQFGPAVVRVEGAESPTVNVSFHPGSAARDLLREHLRGDPLWKVLAEWEKALAAHVIEKIGFRRKAIALLQEKTGYRLANSRDPEVTPPCVYTDTAGPLLFEVATRRIFKMLESIAPETIIADTTIGAVTHLGTILAKAPGDEEACRVNLLEALEDLQGSPEAIRLENTYELAKESSAKARKTVEEIVLLGMVPGQCRICRRLGI